MPSPCVAKPCLARRERVCQIPMDGEFGIIMFDELLKEFGI